MKIRFPAYRLKKYEKKVVDNNVTYIEDKWGKRVLDNKNIQHPSLGLRRLALSRLDYIKLYPLRNICYTYKDLLNSPAGSEFVDSNGIVFKLNKKRYVPLVYKKVLKTIITENNTILCKVEGIYKYIEIAFIPAIMPKYLGLLNVADDWFLYSLEQHRKKDSRRKV